ncbi:hypothetical protein O181_008272 [Austropuccinia psidii MF-1]|uniref:Uncharacterized protein n=1 Tax=Austropuccinia psidii MF-1 TaxID=1389203 RepID=A0A9Q3BPE6_9BASI|nr:hypothetical protein [Austropuccinia psidii MF-1]
MQIYLGEDSGTVKDSRKLAPWRKRILVIPGDSIDFVVVNTKIKATNIFIDKQNAPVLYDDHRCIVKELFLLSPLRIHPNICDKKEGRPSTKLQFLQALPPHWAAPPGKYERIKEEGPSPLEGDEVNI